MTGVNKNKLVIQTSPGDDMSQPFSPPCGWDGDKDAYLELMRIRYKTPPHGVYMASILRKCRQSRLISYSGPWADQAEFIVSTLCKAD